ncbi:hypothetical protein B0O99DRAFT_625665 [Bisporella sp. PMI_857]|nr:hypothetical protein B0O99DRAFT_625665 [Bisporella sp. PMI_857]
MKREHITLPTLQVAAAAFFITACQAKAHCVDKSRSVVAESNCDGTHPGEFFLVQGSVVKKAAAPLFLLPDILKDRLSGGFGRPKEDGLGGTPVIGTPLGG